MAPLAPSPAMVRVALARIVASDAFDAPERNRRFLEYIVEETLAGNAGRIKAYSIAIAVFGRDDGFDPQTDPIVRIEASRLRRSLERYYLLAGQDDALRIDIPKGGYVPTFERRPPALDDRSSAAVAAAADHDQRASPFGIWPFATVGGAALVAALLVWVTGGIAFEGGPDERGADASGVANLSGEFGSAAQSPRILVMPFVDDGGQAAGARLAHGVTREIVVGLTRFSDLFVYNAETGPRDASAAASDPAAGDPGVDFLLQGGVSVLDGQFRVSASLVDAASGRHLWSGRFERASTASDIIAVRDQLADQIVRALAQPYGVLFSTKVLEIDGKPLETLGSYECVLLYQQYWRQLTAAAFPPVRDCLERAIVVEPDYAEAFASLALIYIDNYRAGFGEPIEDALRRALTLATRATELAPASAPGYKALYLVHWLTNDVERSLEAAERALALNPNDTEMMAELGLRYALRNEWPRGLALIDKAYAHNPNLPGLYRIGPFLRHYREGRFTEALAEAKRIDTPDIVYGHICLAMAAAQLGRSDEATAALERIAGLHPDYGEHVIADLAKRNVHPEIIAMVVEGLAKAGLEVTDHRWHGALSARRNEAAALGRPGAGGGKVP